jgi:hypothetical protein
LGVERLGERIAANKSIVPKSVPQTDASPSCSRTATIPGPQQLPIENTASMVGSFCMAPNIVLTNFVASPKVSRGENPRAEPLKPQVGDWGARRAVERIAGGARITILDFFLPSSNVKELAAPIKAVVMTREVTKKRRRRNVSSNSLFSCLVTTILPSAAALLR